MLRMLYTLWYSRLHLHFHPFLLCWWNLYRHHTNQLACKVRRLYEGLKLYYDRFSSRNGPGIFHNSANNCESWSRKSDCVTLGELKDDMLTHIQRKKIFRFSVCILYPLCSLKQVNSKFSFRVNTLLPFHKNVDITYNVSSKPPTPPKNNSCVRSMLLFIIRSHVRTTSRVYGNWSCFVE